MHGVATSDLCFNPFVVVTNINLINTIYKFVATQLDGSNQISEEGLHLTEE